MKIEQTRLVAYDEVDPQLRMKLPVLFRRLQQAALHHSESVGLGTREMMASGAVWILNRMRVKVLRLPLYGESLTVRTWHKGSAGFRAGRDFLLFCGEDRVAAATSQWLLFDLTRKRIVKIPNAVVDSYTDEPEEVFDAAAIDFSVDKRFDPQATLAITTREGDYDPNGHVNNAVYLDYLDTLLKRTGMAGDRVTEVGIQYLKEIGQAVHTIEAGVAQADSERVWFRLFDAEDVYAAGYVACGRG